MFNRNALAVTVVVALGSLGLASTASASDASVKAADNAHDAQFSSLTAKQRKATIAWAKADHSKGTSVPLLRILKKADRLAVVVTKDVKAQAPSTPTGVQAKQYALRSDANYSRYLRALGKAVRLATAGKITAANRQLKLATGYAMSADQQDQAAEKLFAQVL
jgi:hypothetical protein